MILPLHTNFVDWAHSLVIDFSTDNIPIFHEGMDWKLWGNLVAQQPNFSANGVPTTQKFDDQMMWAMATYKQMLNFA